MGDRLHGGYLMAILGRAAACRLSCCVRADAKGNLIAQATQLAAVRT